MTSKLKCPVCDVPLTECGDMLSCPNDHCGWVGNSALWQALIQAKQDLDFFIKEQVRTQTALIERTKELDKCQKDLEIATKAMNQVMSMGAKNNICYHLKAPSFQ